MGSPSPGPEGRRRGLLARLCSADPMRPLDRRASILANIEAVLNTRQGDSSCDPRYGIPDFVDAVHTFPNSAWDMARTIQETLKEYEPRLRRVRVRPLDADEAGPLTPRMRFAIEGRIAGDRSRAQQSFRGVVHPEGRVDVRE